MSVTEKECRAVLLSARILTHAAREAREQVLTKNGLEDAPVTLPHHPLKKFAEAFTRNFDLIAERKSVIFHLRELAKAKAELGDDM